jgi:hypothetical protein
MDKKRLLKNLPPEDTKGFEEFIEGQSSDTNFLPRPTGSTKKETSFEHFTFLTTDGERLLRIKNLLMEKLPFSSKYDQGASILKQQKDEVKKYKTRLFEMSESQDSAYRKSIKEIFDSFFQPPKT